jgi:hypothetical protein
VKRDQQWAAFGHPRMKSSQRPIHYRLRGFDSGLKCLKLIGGFLRFGRLIDSCKPYFELLDLFRSVCTPNVGEAHVLTAYDARTLNSWNGFAAGFTLFAQNNFPQNTERSRNRRPRQTLMPEVAISQGPVIPSVATKSWPGRESSSWPGLRAGGPGA